MARRKGYHISAAARAARIGKKHPHRGYHGHRKFKGRHYHGRHYHGRKTKGRKRPLPRHTGKKHPHAGHGKGHSRVRHPRVRHTVVRHAATAKKKPATTRRPARRARKGQYRGHFKFWSRFVRRSRHNRLRSQFVHQRHAFRNRFTRHRRR